MAEKINTTAPSGPGGPGGPGSMGTGEKSKNAKKAFKQFFREGIYSEIAPEPIRPSAEECYLNSRAHSAKLRWAIKA